MVSSAAEYSASGLASDMVASSEELEACEEDILVGWISAGGNQFIDYVV